MKRLHICFILGVFGLLVATAATISRSHNMQDSAKGWFAAGSEPSSYDMGSDEQARQGSKSAYIKSKAKAIQGFGTYMQMCGTEGYLGKHIRMTGWIKSENVKNWAGMWFRVDGEKMHTLSFDNMRDRPIQGTTDWKQYEISLDVPNEAKDLAFGVLLDGTGSVYFDDVQIVASGPLTGEYGMAGKSKFQSKPSNLNFEE